MMDERPAPGRRRALAAGVCALLLLQPLQPLQARGPGGRAHAVQSAADNAYGNRETVTLALNQSRVIKLRTQAARVSVAAPNIADILVLDPRQIYVVGKEVGSTNLILWDAKDQVRGTIALDVTPDLELLKSHLHEILPGERVQVRSAQGAVVVSGTVSSPQKAEAAAQVAQSFADAAAKDQGKGKVLNMIQIGGSQQVLLEVKVAEVSRDLVKRLDINFTGFGNGGSIKIGTAGSGTTFPDAIFKDPVLGDVRRPQFADTGMWGPAVPEFAPGKTTVQDTAVFLQSLSGNFLFNLVIDAAKNNGLARILAEPNLTTLSGQQAKFQAGGEFPIPVSQGSNNGTSIEYKQFGVIVTFVPVVLDSGVISLKLNVSVSDLTTTNSVTLPTGATGSNFYIPALTTRNADSTVEIKSGQTIAIAGLINESLRENVDKFPGLGEIPVLGMLFRSQEFVKKQTELVIFVTPRLARSFDPQQVKLPTDSFVEPSDLEFYLMGRTQGRKHQPGDSTPTGTLGPDKSGSEGFFGHDL
ncbi:type II and III secretion system protein family protein [uncultured Thiodictyon sp.]|jgi:pilus assembly protein CpaC|uniref:type II and III secretion system protein family protein n=1 Tax=uncultured Thiodictyon sp. TaxID=1846217 RepID=UPI0025F253B3|nr:type II and III secretion system protein family protein [uncultured Thiodictyon sp.]